MRQFLITTPEGVTMTLYSKDLRDLIEEVAENRGITGEAEYLVRESGRTPVKVKAISYRKFRTAVSEVEDVTE